MTNSSDAETHASWLSCIERGEPCRSFADVDTWNGDRFEDDVDWACARLASVGIGEVVVVDLTKEEFGIPVVRVVIPGLEGVDSSSNYAPASVPGRVCEATHDVFVMTGPSLPPFEARTHSRR